MSAFLLAEDDDAIAIAFCVAVDEAKIPVVVDRVSNGAHALEYLRRAGLFAAAQSPALVFLDLNMPLVDGWQVLSEMRADNDLQSIPVVIFSTSSHPAERKRAYACGAQYFLMKPATFAGLV